MAFRSVGVLLAFAPIAASANTPSHSASYKLGWHVGRLIGTYGIYLAAAALLGVFAWLWIRRAKARATRP